MILVEHIAGIKELRIIYKTMVGKTRGKSLAGPRYRWKDSIKIDLKEMGLEGEDWIHLAQHQQ
jgi:hypothetical protein